MRSAAAIGAANGVVSGGPVAFEVNHPGALCWGAGIPAGDPLKAITPDIQTGDRVSLSQAPFMFSCTIYTVLIYMQNIYCSNVIVWYIFGYIPNLVLGSSIQLALSWSSSSRTHSLLPVLQVVLKTLTSTVLGEAVAQVRLCTSSLLHPEGSIDTTVFIKHRLAGRQAEHATLATCAGCYGRHETGRRRLH